MTSRFFQLRYTWLMWGFTAVLGLFLLMSGCVAAPGEETLGRGTGNSPGLATIPARWGSGRTAGHTITIRNGSSHQTLHTTAPTVGAALAEAGITLYAADTVEPPPNSPVTPGMTIQVHTSFPVTIQADGSLIQTRARHTNALDIIAAAGVTLVGMDYTKPGPETAVQPNGVIQVIRVTEDFRVEEQPIPYTTIWQARADLPLDTQTVVSPGVPGLAQNRARVRYENGVEVSREVDSQWVVHEPVNEVVGYGTKISLGVVQTEQGPREYWRVVRMRVTSYTAASSGKEPDDPSYGLTASGLPAGKGVVAIDRNIVPFRSQVFVPGYGVAVAGDTGGGVRGRWIDLGWDEDNFAAWSGYVDVYYLTPVPPPEDINYILPAVLP
ncbi:MAG: G5 domain-containing protein [Chloroflexi bacterium]|nr:G5 domain-containing protein [Chloroflexota bacterium]